MRQITIWYRTLSHKKQYPILFILNFCLQYQTGEIKIIIPQMSPGKLFKYFNVNILQMLKQYTRVLICCYLMMACINVKAQEIEWIKQIKGAASAELGEHIVTDASGNIYTAGTFTGTADFDPGPGVFELTAARSDIFFLKLDPNGEFIWAKQFKGTHSSYINSLALDKSGFAYLAGIFLETVDFDPGPGTYPLTSAGEMDAFYLKLDSSGSFKWAQRIGAAKTDQADGIRLDKTGNIYVTGWFSDTVDFDPDTTVSLKKSRTYWNMFVLKLSASGKFVWVRQFDDCFGERCVIDSLGNVYTAGTFFNTVDFDPGPATYNLTSNGAYYDVFISKLDSSGNFVWAKRIGGPESDQGHFISSDAAGNLYIAGIFDKTVDFNPGTSIFNLTSFGSWDIFVLKLKASGDFVWAKQLGGKLTERVNAMHVDPAGNVYVTGEFQKTADLDPGNAVFLVNTFKYEHLYDEFALKLNASGNFQWAKKFGGDLEEDANTIYSDASGSVYIAGHFEGTVNFDSISGNIINLVSTGNKDAFICKLGNTITGIHSLSSKMSHHAIFPVPNNGVFTVRYSGQLSGSGIEIYNAMGVLIYSKSDLEEINTIKLQNQVNGLYIVRIIDASGTVYTENILIF